MILLCTVHVVSGFSRGGTREGGDVGTGKRSSLMFETIRIVKNLKPKYILWENVSSVLDDEHIHNFIKYLKTMEKLGYNNYNKILNAKDYEIPQNRDRIFVLSIRKDIDDMQFVFPQKQELTTSYKNYLEEDYTNYSIQIILKPNHLKRVKGNDLYEAKYGFGGRTIKDDENIYPTIVASAGCASGYGAAIKCKEGWRRLTPQESWRLMRF